MLSLPTGVNSAEYLLVLVGDFLIFILIALSFRLLKPRKVSATLWVSPIFHLYTLLAVFIALYVAVSSEALASVGADFGLFLVAALLGAGLGRVVGKRIPVTRGSDGKPYYTGGKLLVGLLVFLLLPLALEQAVVLLGALANVQSLLNAVTGAAPFNYLLLGVGFLFVLGTFMSIMWRGAVWDARKGPAPPTQWQAGAASPPTGSSRPPSR